MQPIAKSRRQTVSSRESLFSPGLPSARASTSRLPRMAATTWPTPCSENVVATRVLRSAELVESSADEEAARGYSPPIPMPRIMRATTRNHSVDLPSPAYATVHRMEPTINSTQVATMLTLRPKTSPRKPNSS
ncbi:uncharacterized protein KRP23_11192 [Phytophthora ramorum]|uniref:uncharacterized protein n=1 Tax=Phytophthora ramorum TaxID=164328 RepID=UPI0030AE66AF|nr:hypothetical protein KRP23_11192 [Phytophthora ramorum]